MIAVSAIPILEMIRISTATMQISETDAAVRTLAGDVLKRLAGAPHPGVADPLRGKIGEALLGVPMRADLILATDAALAHGFPTAELLPELTRSNATISVKIQSPYSHPSLPKSAGIDSIVVTARWVDYQNSVQVTKEFSLARLVAIH